MKSIPQAAFVIDIEVGCKDVHEMRSLETSYKSRRTTWVVKYIQETAMRNAK
jgi:hypothetical protein